jgi:hypothetical protein
MCIRRQVLIAKTTGSSIPDEMLQVARIDSLSALRRSGILPGQRPVFLEDGMMLTVSGVPLELQERFGVGEIILATLRCTEGEDVSDQLEFQVRSGWASISLSRFVSPPGIRRPVEFYVGVEPAVEDLETGTIPPTHVVAATPVLFTGVSIAA